MKAILVTLSPLVVCLMLMGCDAPPPARPSMSIILLPDVSEERALAGTREVLREFKFSIETADPGAGYLRTSPIEQTIFGGTGRISDPFVRSPNRIRLIAEAYVRAREGGSEVRLAVSRERLDTATYRTYAREHRNEDMPTETPIDREAGTSPEQYESWTPIGRDRELEGNLRQALEERLAGGE